VDGICGAQTWAALVEAGHRLGDRLLYLRRPMLRGDDVADLQRRLGTLGFDAGRVDGIFGPQTEEALAEFQRNVGITVDRICGPATLQALGRLSGRSPDQPVSRVREREHLRRTPPTLAGRRVAVGQNGGLDALTRQVERCLTQVGAEVVLLHHPDGSELATGANTAAADVFIQISLSPDTSGCTTAFYAAHGWESTGGRRLAELVQHTLPAAVGVTDAGARGMSLPVLRETKMPAVLCEIGPAQVAVERAAALATAITDALSAWAAAPCD
jgi:N-acetylmuramoyl-L-alanine amidase